MQLAAIDLGSNSFRLQIGRVRGSHVEPQGYWKETIRLASGVDADGRLNKKTLAAACECLARMNERLRGFAAPQVRAVGTETLRNLRDLDAFLLEAQHALGYPIDIISGREEARLTFEGCMHTLPSSPHPRLVVDIGGASTELILGRGFDPDFAESFKAGCVNSTERFFASGVIDKSSFRRAHVDAAAELEEAITTFGHDHWREAYGSSGTIAAVAQTLRALDWGEGSVTGEGLARLRQLMIEFGEIRKLKLPAVKPERMQVLAGGVAILTAVFDSLRIEQMWPARGGLRLGLLYDLLGRREHRDPRDGTVARLQKRFEVDRAQAQRVAQIAATLFASLAPGADDEAAKRLKWAAELHEIGFAISHNDYHKHGAYLIENGDLPGFSTTDQERIARLILAQRGNLRKVAAALEDETHAAKVLALRLAVVLCHARLPVELPDWSVRAQRSGFELRLDADWLKSYPLTAHLLEGEVQQWGKVSRRLAIKAS